MATTAPEIREVCPLCGLSSHVVTGKSNSNDNDNSSPGQGGASSDAGSSSRSPLLESAPAFLSAKTQQLVLDHLAEEHKVVVDSLDGVDAGRYFAFWKSEFATFLQAQKCSVDAVLAEFCAGVRLNNQTYFVLGGVLPEDTARRSIMRQLQRVLDHQHVERTSPDVLQQFALRDCLFCRKPVPAAEPLNGTQTSRDRYFAHLLEVHHFSLGPTENLVFSLELVDVLDARLSEIRCLFCDGQFKSHPVLRDHMRKKKHMKLNPESKEFDRFFVSSYLESDATWRARYEKSIAPSRSAAVPLVRRPKPPLADYEESRRSRADTWSEWVEESDSPINCLFCREVIEEARERGVAGHYEERHSFPVLDLFRDHGFYGLVAAVNHSCASFQSLRCPRGSACGQPRFGSRAELLRHANAEKHCAPTGQFRLTDDDDDAGAFGDWDWRHERFLLPTVSEDSSADYQALLSSVEIPDSDEDADPSEKPFSPDHDQPRYIELANGVKVDIKTLM